LGIINFYDFDLGFAAVLFGFYATFAADIIHFLTDGSQFIHAIMNTENSSG
jgi:hypothetical protein